MPLVRPLIAAAVLHTVIFRHFISCTDNIDVAIIKAEGDTVLSRLVAYGAVRYRDVKKSTATERINNGRAANLRLKILSVSPSLFLSLCSRTARLIRITLALVSAARSVQTFCFSRPEYAAQILDHHQMSQLLAKENYLIVSHGICLFLSTHTFIHYYRHFI